MLDFFELLGQSLNYDERKIDRTIAGEYIISTCYTIDFGYETAILDNNDAYPVERYHNKELAIAGHIKWVEIAPTLTTINRLSVFTEDDDVEAESLGSETITLEPMNDEKIKILMR